jgi:very-short-patch-repair endonuclease
MKESIGEATLAMHLKAKKIEFQQEVCLVPGRKYRWDFYLRQKDLAIEVSGQTWQKGGHSSGAGILRDYRKNNAAVVAGLKCLFFTTQQVESGEAIETIKQALGA